MVQHFGVQSECERTACVEFADDEYAIFRGARTWIERLGFIGVEDFHCYRTLAATIPCRSIERFESHEFGGTGYRSNEYFVWENFRGEWFSALYSSGVETDFLSVRFRILLLGRI